MVKKWRIDEQTDKDRLHTANGLKDFIFLLSVMKKMKAKIFSIQMLKVLKI